MNDLWLLDHHLWKFNILIVGMLQLNLGLNMASPSTFTIGPQPISQSHRVCILELHFIPACLGEGGGVTLYNEKFIFIFIMHNFLNI